MKRLLCAKVIVESFDEDSLSNIMGGKRPIKRSCKCKCDKVNCFGDTSSKAQGPSYTLPTPASPSSCEAGNCFKFKG